MTITIAGRRFDFNYPAAANLSHVFVWDGLDSFGLFATNSQTAKITIAYRYKAVYYGASENFAQSFALIGASSGSGGGGGGGTLRFLGQRVSETIRITRRWDKALTGLVAESAALGGLTLNVHHHYDPDGPVLYLGNGVERSSAISLTNTITTVAGSGTQGTEGDGGAATNGSSIFLEQMKWC